MTLVASAPTTSTSSAVVRMPSPGTLFAARDVPLQPRGVERADEPVDQPEDPDERRHADDERHGDEEPRDEAAAQPLHRSTTTSRPPSLRTAPDPAAMRYQANGTNPTRRTTARNGLTTSAEAMNARTKPMAISAARSGARWCRTLSRLCANAAIMVGMARKNENSAAAARSSPSDHAADDRRARPRHARHQRQHLARADRQGLRDRRPVRVEHRRRRAIPFDHQHHDAAQHERRRDDAGAGVEHRRDVVGQEQRPREPPARTRRESSPQTAARRDPTAAPPRSRTILARYSHITARIDPSWIITVKTPPGS